MAHTQALLRVLNDWATPATKYERRKHGRVEIAGITYERGHYQSYFTNGARFYELTCDVQVTDLRIDGDTWMVDDPPHWWAMLDHASHFSGNVLVAGLGLGLIVHALAARPEVKSVVVVEREHDVISAVWDELPHGGDTQLMCIEDDFWRVASDAEGFDGVFYDLFVGDGRELTGDAIRCRFELDDIFGEIPIRIHGFENERLDHLSSGRAAAKKLFEGMAKNEHG